MHSSILLETGRASALVTIPEKMIDKSCLSFLKSQETMIKHAKTGTRCGAIYFIYTEEVHNNEFVNDLLSRQDGKALTQSRLRLLRHAFWVS